MQSTSLNNIHHNDFLPQVRNHFLHLRLNFSYILSPIYLWGYLLSGMALDGEFLLGFSAFHIFLYGGTNAFNSYYDKDEGPIGGLKKPPPVTPSLLYTSVIVKIIGLILAFFINRMFISIYIIALLLSIAYSHPAFRWKGLPINSALVVALGQGGLGFLAGFVVGTTDLQSIFQAKTLLGAAGTSFLTLGIYPLTQVYQMEEDYKRKDRTFAMALDVKGSFIFAFISLGLAGLLVIAVIFFYISPFEALVMAIYFILLNVLVFKWLRTFRKSTVSENYDRIMRINYFNSTAFSAYILAHIVKVL